MTSFEIILILAGIPLGMMILLGVLTLGPTLRRTPSYRPGQAWDHPPVWWTASSSLGHSHGADQHQQSSDSEHGGARGDW